MTLQNLLCLFIVLLPASLAAQYSTGNIFKESEYTNQPYKSWKPDKFWKPRISRSNLPEAYSLRPYCPSALSQGQFGTCTAWALSNARTIHYNNANDIKAPANVDSLRFSQAYIYKQLVGNKIEVCSVGTSIHRGLEILKQKGVCFKSTLPSQCAMEQAISKPIDDEAKNYRIRGYKRIEKIQSNFGVKECKYWIANGKPIIGSFLTPPSFNSNSPKSWKPAPSEYPEMGSGHAMVIVGYDDEKKVTGGWFSKGAFLIMNSWGRDWKDNGFTWISYKDFKDYCRGAYYMIPPRHEAAKNFDGTLHIIAMGETDHPKNGDIAMKNINIFIDQFSNLATAALFEPKSYLLIGSDNKYENLEKTLNSIQVGPKDIIAFYYIGAAFNSRTSNFPYLNFPDGSGKPHKALQKIISQKEPKLSIIISDCHNTKKQEFHTPPRSIKFYFPPDGLGVEIVSFNKKLSDLFRKTQGSILLSATDIEQQANFYYNKESLLLDALSSTLSSDISHKTTTWSPLLEIASLKVTHQADKLNFPEQTPIYQIKEPGKEDPTLYFSCSIQESLSQHIESIVKDSTFLGKKQKVIRLKGKYAPEAKVIVLLNGIPVEQIDADRYFREIAINASVSNLNLKGFLPSDACTPETLIINEQYEELPMPVSITPDTTKMIEERLKQKTVFFWENLSRFAASDSISIEEKEWTEDALIHLFKNPESDTVELLTLDPTTQSVEVRYETPLSFIKERVDDFYRSQYEKINLDFTSLQVEYDGGELGSSFLKQMFSGIGRNQSVKYEDITNKHLEFQLEGQTAEGLKIKLKNIKVRNTNPIDR